MTQLGDVTLRAARSLDRGRPVRPTFESQHDEPILAETPIDGYAKVAEL